MKNLSGVIAVASIALMASNVSFADAEAGQSYFSVMGSYIDDDKDRGVEDELNGGQLGFGYAINDRWNVEALLSLANAKSGDIVLRPDQDQLGLGVDMQRVFRRAERFSPYLHFGIGYFSVDPSGGLPKEKGGMASAGAGFLLDLNSFSNVALRTEFRHRRDNAFSGRDDLSDNIFSIGLQIPFGPRTPDFVDSDGDGVADGLDRCPRTPAGAAVDSTGCELDSDGDGVRNSMDKCPGTAAGVRVDASGCAIDTDGDGISDDKDKCPGTPVGAKVDANGCELDGDRDGVVDRLDQCPNSRAGAQVDIKGCEIKAEIKLPGVNFESNSDRLLPGAENVLRDAAATLRKNPTITVEVAGHTDSDGAAAYNESLSARRAETVHDYLVANGIAEERMSVRGYGESQPIADNGTRDGKAQNRRVVLRVIDR